MSLFSRYVVLAGDDSISIFSRVFATTSTSNTAVFPPYVTVIVCMPTVSASNPENMSTVMSMLSSVELL